MNEENQQRFGFVNFAETWNVDGNDGYFDRFGTELITGQSILSKLE